jgi:hypothetical protein
MSAAAGSLSAGGDAAGEEEVGDHDVPTGKADRSWEEYDKIIGLFYLDTAAHTPPPATPGEATDASEKGDVDSPDSNPFTDPEASRLTASAVKRRDGWSEAAIARFLRSPDGFGSNPHCPTAPPMRLYRADRVEAVEATPEFATWREGHSRRSEAARRAASRGRSCALEAVAAWVPGLSELHWTDVLEQAIREHNEREMSCTDADEFIPVHIDDDASVVQGVVVDFLIRHGAQIVLGATRPGDRTAVRAALRGRLGQLVAERLRA